MAHTYSTTIWLEIVGFILPPLTAAYMEESHCVVEGGKNNFTIK
jgi:hypothetical protein